MKTVLDKVIESVAEFLVHALELEEQSADHYKELADSMEVHNNPEVADLFRKLAKFSCDHAGEVKQRAKGLELPSISPWDFKWTHPDAPEANCRDKADYLMTVCDALMLALHNERQGRDFYRHVSNTACDDEARRLAAEMADEEHEHVGMLEDWLRNAREIGEERIHDPDPPNIPE